MFIISKKFPEIFMPRNRVFSMLEKNGIITVDLSYTD